MQRQVTQGFNKEKLFFLMATLGFALGLYLFLASRPVALEVGKPISAQSEPEALNPANSENPKEERFYLVDGKLTRMLDPRTGQLVNRERKTPFAPVSGYAIVRPPKTGSQVSSSARTRGSGMSRRRSAAWRRRWIGSPREPRTRCSSGPSAPRWRSTS